MGRRARLPLRRCYDAVPIVTSPLVGGRANSRRVRAAGQTLPIFALMLPVVIGMAGLGIDGGNVYLNYRNAQTAADLAALAGARLLPASPSSSDYTAAEIRA